MKTLLALFTILFCLTSQAADYVRPCHDIEGDYLQTNLNIAANIWTITHTAFEERECATPYLIYEEKYSVAQNGQNIDMSAVEVSYTPTSELVAEVLNQINYCGLTNWKVFGQQIVTGKMCDDYQTPRENEFLYSIYKLENNGTELFLGMPTENLNGKTPARRHNTLDPFKFVRSN